MMDQIFADQALEVLSCAIADVIEEVHPVTVEVHISGDRSREDVLVEAGQDILALVAAMKVIRRRVVADTEAVRDV